MKTTKLVTTSGKRNATVLLVWVALAPLLGGADLLLRRSRAVEQGNGHMKAGKAEEALAEYDKALTEVPNEPGVHFNRGTALYGLSRWDDAAQAFLRATEARTPDLKASAFYNLGNTFFQAQKFEEAAQAFKKSLAYNPGDLRAKWNLELALRKKKEEEDKKKEQQKKPDPNQQKQQQDQKNADQKEQKGEEDKQDPNQQQDKGDQDPDQQQEQQQQAKQDPPKPPEPKPEEQAKDQKNGQKPDQKPEPQPNPESQNQAKNKPASQGKEPPRPPADVSEMEAILDNLERSPKALEQELARLRALNRKPPAKDW
jgi:tetratricopeptide (TPR) repeat protein